MIGSDPLSRKWVNYLLSCIEGNGSYEDIQCSAQNATIFVDRLKIYYTLFYQNNVIEYLLLISSNLYQFDINESFDILKKV